MDKGTVKFNPCYKLFFSRSRFLNFTNYQSQRVKRYASGQP